MALGTANIAAGFFHGFAVSASATRTSVAESAGAVSQATGVVGAAAVIVILVVGVGLASDLPSATLAAIVIAGALTPLRSEKHALALEGPALGVPTLVRGVRRRRAARSARRDRHCHRPLGRELRSTRGGHTTRCLGRVPGRKGYHDIERHPDAVQIPGLVLYRFDAPLFFANADRFARRLLDAIDGRGEPTRWVIIAAEPLTDIDTTAAETLSTLLDDLEVRGADVAFAELKGPVKDRLRAYGLYDRIGDARFFPTLGTAINAYLRETGTKWTDWSDDRGQRNRQGDA